MRLSTTSCAILCNICPARRPEPRLAPSLCLTGPCECVAVGAAIAEAASRPQNEGSASV